MSVYELTQKFGARPRPRSGVVSRSRLRAWYFDEGGTEEYWGDFVRWLVQQRLWRPWHGDDIALLDSEPTTRGGYRDSAPQAKREGELTYFTVPTGFGVPFLFLLFGLLFTLVPASYGDLTWYAPLGLAFALVVHLVLYVRARLRKRVLRVSQNTVRVEHPFRRDLKLQDILWVDVVHTSELPDAPVSRAVIVLAKTRDGREHVLTEALEVDVALSVCRAIESAMIDARKLELANRAKVRVAADEHVDELERIVAGATEQER